MNVWYKHNTHSGWYITTVHILYLLKIQCPYKSISKVNMICLLKLFSRLDIHLHHRKLCNDQLINRYTVVAKVYFSSKLGKNYTTRVIYWIAECLMVFMSYVYWSIWSPMILSHSYTTWMSLLESIKHASSIVYDIRTLI